MKILSLITYLNLLLLFTSCNGQTIQAEEHKIDKIILSSVDGGKGGGSSLLQITKDSIFYKNNNIAFPRYNKTIKKKIPESLWKKLMDSLNIKNFILVKSNPGHVQYDGSDVTLSLYSKRKTYSVINAEDDEINFKKVKSFYNIINNISYQLSDVYGLNGKSFSSQIGNVCVETSPPNPCAGYQIYLELNFKEFEVEVIEKEMNACGKLINQNEYLSQWYFENPDKVVVKKMVSRNQQIIKNNVLIFNSTRKELIGIAVNKLQDRYIFREKE